MAHVTNVYSDESEDDYDDVPKPVVLRLNNGKYENVNGVVLENLVINGMNIFTETPEKLIEYITLTLNTPGAITTVLFENVSQIFNVMTERTLEITTELFGLFCNKMCDVANVSYNVSSTIARSNIITDAMQRVSVFSSITDDVLMKLLRSSMLRKFGFLYISIKDTISSGVMLCITKIYTGSYGLDKSKLFNTSNLKITNVTMELVEACLTHRDFNALSKKLIAQIKKIPSEKCLCTVILKNNSDGRTHYNRRRRYNKRHADSDDDEKSDDDALDMVKYLVTFGCKLTEKALETACEVIDFELIQFMIQNKVRPTKKSVQILLGYTGKHNVDYNYGRTMKLTKDEIKLNTKLLETVQMFIKLGYKMTYNDIVVATKSHIEFPNFSEFKIKLSSKFIDVCAECGFYPKYGKDIKPTIKSLEAECKKSGNLQQIKKLVATGITPNEKCLENACSMKSNVQAINFLLSKGSKVDINCLHSVVKVMRNKTLSLIFDNYVIASGIKLTEEKNPKCPKAVVVNGKKPVDDSYSDLESDNDNDDVPKKICSDDDSDSDSDSNNEIIIKKPVKKPKVVAKKVINKQNVKPEESDSDDANSDDANSDDANSDDDNSDDDNSDDDNDDNEDKLDTVEQLDVKTKLYPNDKVVKLLSLKAKTQYTFLEVRKIFLTYLIKNKLLVENDIKSNKVLTDIIGSGKYTLEDLDKIVTVALNYGKTTDGNNDDSNSDSDNNNSPKAKPVVRKTIQSKKK
jgi:hypothetical protein